MSFLVPCVALMAAVVMGLAATIYIANILPFWAVPLWVCFVVSMAGAILVHIRHLDAESTQQPSDDTSEKNQNDQ